MKKVGLVFYLFFVNSFAYGAFFHVSPYIQKSKKGELNIMWEAKHRKSPNLKINDPETDTTKEYPVQKVSEHGTYERGRHLYRSNVTDLEAGKKYVYWVEEDGKTSEPFILKTQVKDPESFAYLVMSDAQHGHKVTTKAIRDSVMKHAFFEYRSESEFPISFTLFAGDLVQHGSKYKRWKKEFFDPMSPLISRVPLYPALGNHEEDDKLYFSYFDLPKNAQDKYQEHWYYFDYGNVRFITLDTNKKYRVQAQLDWLESVLENAKDQSRIDFVVAQFHHPHKSELWLKGETAFSGKLEKKMVNFTKASGKPSLYYCGHTHGYSRGHHPETNHTMLVVGSIGGAIDDWGDYRQRDYNEYTKTLDEFGWMMVQVTSGENPKMSFKRFSFGNDSNQRDLGVVDDFVLKRYNNPPKKPMFSRGANYDSSNQTFKVHLGSYSDEDDDHHLSTHVEIAKSPIGKVIKSYMQHNENWYAGRDQNAGMSLTAPSIKVNLEPSQDYYYRVRFRDSSLAWSEFSEWRKIRIN